MNDAAVRKIWQTLNSIGRRLLDLEIRMNKLDAHVRARLKEEADWALSEEEKIKEADKVARSLR